MAVTPSNVCKECEGTGEIEGEFHVQCLGTGEISSTALHIFFKKTYDDVTDKLNDVMEKVESIEDIVEAL